MFSNPPIVLALLFAFLGLVLLIVVFAAIRKKKISDTALSALAAFSMLALSALFATISIAIQGYQAFTHEELAAIVKVEPVGGQKFNARFTMPDGSTKTFSLAGDQLYVDAHILKWKPLANVLGLHTSYELDRVAGRYTVLNDETTKARTVYALSKDKPLDMFNLRLKFAMLKPLLDAEYGSATFINSSSADEFRVMVSTSGLLIRKNGPDR